MSLGFVLSGESSVLSSDYNPPIYLEDNVNYEIGLINFDSFYSIPNIDVKNNTFMWWDDGGKQHTEKILTGSYEITKILELMQSTIMRNDDDALITMKFDTNTAKVTLRTNRKISFDIENSLGPVVGFNKRIIVANTNEVGDSPVQIIRINTICIDCNIAAGSFLNGEPVHIIYSFFPSVSPGYKIIETPSNTIYYPVTLKRINNITLRIIDQNGELVDFRNETCTVRLHLRKVN